MPLAYYFDPPTREYWSSLWQGQELRALLAIAAIDPLSDHLLRYLPKRQPILEGGCGLGQYVAYFRERGYQIIGGDYSIEALETHRQVYAESPLVGLDLRAMPFLNESLGAHISLGVIEHLEALEKTRTLLCEFWRTLCPNGILLLGVPWMNGYRTVLGPWLQCRQNRQRAAGKPFYQYAFSRRELSILLEGTGFRVLAFRPYSPARGMRELPLFAKLHDRLKKRRSSSPAFDIEQMFV